MTSFEENYAYVRRMLNEVLVGGVMDKREVLASIDVCIQEAYARGRREERETTFSVSSEDQKPEI